MKLIKKITVGTLAVALPTAALVTSTSFAANQEKNKIYFQGRIFNSVDEAMAFLVQKQKVEFKNHRVLGDIERSYINSETGLLNKSLLPDYDPANMHFAYRNAGGGLTPNYDEAKQTYFNPGTIVSVYDDGYGNQDFLSEKEAEESMRRYSISSKIGFYNVDYLAKGGGGILNYIPKKMNPFNVKDINNFKENIKDNIFEIIKESIEDDKNNSKYKISNFKIIQKNGQEKKNDNNLNVNTGFLEMLENKINNSNIKWKMKGGILSKTLSEEEKNVELESDWRGIGTWRSNDSRESSWNGVKYRIQNYGKNWQWLDSKPIFNKGNTDNATSLQNFINGTKVNLLKMTHIGETKITDNEERVTSFEKLKNNVKKWMDNYESLQSKNNQSIFYTNNLIKTSILKKLDVKTNILTQISSNNWKKDSFEVTKMPDFDIDKQKGSPIWWNEVKISRKKYSFKFKRTIKLNLKDNFSEKAKINNMLSKMLKWKNKDESVAFTIQKDGGSLFDVKLKYDGERMKVDEIVLSKKNHGNSLPAPTKKEEYQFNNQNKPLPVDDKIIQKWFYWMLQSLNKELTTNDDIGAISRIFHKYFGDKNKYFGKASQNPKYKYNIDFHNSELILKQYMEINEALKMHVNSMNEAYQKYKDTPKLLKEISKKIIDPKDIFIQEKKYNNKLILGKYMMKSIDDFNASISKGYFSSSSSLATNQNEWNSIKQNMKFIPAHLLVAYDTNGKKSNVGNYNNDNQLLLKFNILLNKEPRRDYGHIFIGGTKVNNFIENSTLVKNIITNIYSVNLENIDYYFKTFKQLKRFMIKFIKQNSIKI